MENKKSALTAATVQSARTIQQNQDSTVCEKAQGVMKLKYPLNVDRLITALEVESGQKMDCRVKELFKLLVSFANEAYEFGRNGETCPAEWVRRWKTYYTSEPGPTMKLLLEKIDQFINISYEDGKQAALAEVAV